MLLFVGLGNPNPNNKNNRHNVGFHVIDAINQKFKLNTLIVYPNIVCSTKKIYKKNKTFTSLQDRFNNKILNISRFTK